MAIAQRQNNSVGSTSKQHRLLIVDDDEGVREVLIMGLKRDGYAVAGAANAATAREQLHGAPFDLVLLDLRLSGPKDGLALLAWIREQHSPLNLPVIVISGFAESNDMVAALRQGANDYVTKPFDMHVVRARIKTQLTLKGLKELNDRLLRTASHDLKKPVMLMLDVARQLREDIPAGQAMTEDAHSTLDLLIDTGRYMQKIIEELLDLAPLRAGRLHVTKTATDLGAIVRQAVARNSAYARTKSIDLRMTFAPGMPQIMADDLHIMQVLDNLIGNAIKFSPAGGIATVGTHADGDFLVCEITDNGPGIPEEDMDKLFTEYAQLRNRPTGHETSTGLGLAIAKELVELHGGTIGARNNPAGGATFWIRLPTK